MPATTLINKILNNKAAVSGMNNNVFLKDIIQLRGLLQDLVNMDCMMFWRRLRMIREYASLDSIWYRNDKETVRYIDILFKKAKQRI